MLRSKSAVRLALKEYEKLGATLVDVSLPHSPYALAAYYIVAPAEASSNLARYDGMHYGHRTSEKGDLIATYQSCAGEAFGPEVQRRIILGTYVLSSGYKDAYYLQGTEGPDADQARLRRALGAGLRRPASRRTSPIGRVALRFGARDGGPGRSTYLF